MERKKHLLSLLIFCIFQVVSFGQNETSKWFFGNKAGLDISTSPPTPLLNSAMDALEGCSSIADASGNLLFYTDGITVWDRNHSVMSNGNGLGAYFSANQAAIIAKQPGNTNLYYVFSQGANNGLKYAIVDMSLAAGIGSVTSRNVLVYKPSAEMLTATTHCNGKDIWILSREWKTNIFRANLLTSSGIQVGSLNSVIGSPNAFGFGNLRFSPNGKKLGMVNYNDTIRNTVELFDFDSSTGVVSNSLTLVSLPAATGNTLISSGLYNCEFSPDGTKFYAGQGGWINQWDLCAGSPTAIAASGYSFQTFDVYGMQLAATGEIYTAGNPNTAVCVIHNPNIAGPGCNYQDTIYHVHPNSCRFGLPSFVSTFLRPSPGMFTYSYIPGASCSTYSFSSPSFTNPDPGCSAAGYPVNGIEWLFDDPLSGSANTSTLNTPTHTFSSPGQFFVKLLLFYNCGQDTIKQLVSIGPTLTITANPSFSVCPLQSFTLTATGAQSYTWNTGSTSGTIVTSSASTSTFSVTGISDSSMCAGYKKTNVTIRDCTGIENRDQNSISFKVYSAFGSNVVIENSEKTAVIITDQLGKAVFRAIFSIGEHNLNLDLASGIYYILCQGDNGSRVFKFLKNQ
jgi:hypothetical protein